MRKAHLSFVKLEAVFITHIHGDHVFGLFGLFSTMSMLGRTQVLHVYGPRALGGFVKFFMAYYGDGLGFEIEFHMVNARQPEVIHVSKKVSVTAFPLQHKMECYGYRFDEIVPERRPSNPPFHPCSYAYCSDTLSFPELSDWVRGVGLLYHEATYPQEMLEKAKIRYHSTALQAARCASGAGVRKLLLGHFSSKYPDLDIFLDEARSEFPESFIAQELQTYQIEPNIKE